MKKNRSETFTALFPILTVLVFLMLLTVVKLESIKGKYPVYTGIFTAIMLFVIVTSYIKVKPEAEKKYGNKSKKSRFADAVNVPAAFIKNTLKAKNYNLPLLATWIITCVLMTFSDIIVFKKYWFAGLILLVLFTSVYIIYNHYSSEDKDVIWHWYMCGIEISFLIASVICFLFRPYTEGYRYCGVTINPNVYARFLLAVWICLLFRFSESVYKQSGSERYIRIGVESGMCLFFMFATGSRTSFLAIAIISLIWFILFVYYSRKDNRIFLRHICVTIIIAIPSFGFSYIALTNIPNIINHPIVFDQDKQFVSYETCESVCFAADTDSPDGTLISSPGMGLSIIERINALFDKDSSLDFVLNGRINIYKHYLKKLNLKGHAKYSKKLPEKTVPHAHNSWLQIAYTYGIPAGIAYLVLTILTLIYSFRYLMKFHNKRSTAVLPLLVVLAFLITSLTECIILPIQSLLAFSFYLTIGELINSKS